MVHEMITPLPGEEVLKRAKTFFAERIPHHSAFPDKEGPTFASFRGQGGQEIALAVIANPRGTRVRASALLHDQAVARFFSTLPAVDEEAP